MPKSTDLSDNFSTLSYSYKGSKLPSWLYDPETKGILGKPKGDWIKLLVFYFFFFVFLALFWSFMMSVFIYFIIPTNNPMRTGTHNLLNLKPGLGIRPQIDHETVFIRFSPKDPQTYNGYVQHLDAFLDQYHHLEHNKNKLKCKDGKGETIDDICHYPIEKLGPCSKDYGFADKKPCVLIKMNKIYGWIPELIDDSLKHSMLTCKGSNPLDSDNIGELQYYPSIQNGSLTYGYFDSSFYPYLGQPSYVAPIVAVKFESLKPNVIVHVTCELSNMPSYKDDLASQIRFEIAMDDYAVKSE